MVKEDKGMTLIVKTVTRITLGFILLYGIYLALNGHISPGGGFVGGVIMSLAFIHIMLAFGTEAALKRLGSHGLRFAISVASLIFLYLVMAGPVPIWYRAGRPGNYSRLLIPFCEMVIVGGALFTIFIALVLVSKPDKDSEIGE